MATSIIDILEKFAEDPLPAALVAVGGLAVLKFALGLLGIIYKYLLRPSVKLTKCGKYAVVTGATDGIGKAYALALAKRGMSLVLVSRTESKLKAVADEIDSKNYKGVEKTKYVVCDYSNFDEKTRARVAKELDGLDIGVLINNVGQSYRYPRFFHELSDEEVSGMVEMNVNSTVWMTKMVIDGMAERKRGAIVNLSSGSAEHTMPLLAEYGAAKMFVERFSESLDAEYRGRGVRVQCQIPFYVATKLAKLRKSLTVPTANAYVRMSMRWVGYGGVVQPFYLHGLQGWVMKVMPSFLVDKAVMSMHAGIRKRGLKKDARIAAEGKKE
eukprot:CAMPEP_0181098766 /NCGR_PEP_ID=MMETSP1071-20121207/12305_1 /TAXON_ID=35127 /ORGANISM="Thalassiosira sp., Strain NH16" /LENGTH=326 /DNA_ID=CAMNT_0023181391 /DNA_START=189 /DNA_END=1169 /DNA_ORIENTATION=+